MNIVVDTLFAAATVCLFLVSMIIQPTRARCPKGWWLGEGVRDNGVYACHPPADEKTLERRALQPYPPDVLRSRIYCTGGTRPVIGYDGVVVSCQRGWSN